MLAIEVLIVSGSGTVAPSSAASQAFIGVAANDAANGAPVNVLCGGVQKLVATGTVTAGQSVEAATNGTVATHTLGTNDGNIVGLAVTTATAGNVAYIQMER